MRSIPEHLAAMELYMANGVSDLFESEAFLLTQTHWSELIAQQDPRVMENARHVFEQRVRTQLGDRAEPFIQKWRATFTPVID